MSLGKGMYVNGTMQAKDSFVEMFHSGTPDVQTAYSKICFPTRWPCESTNLHYCIWNGSRYQSSKVPLRQ